MFVYVLQSTIDGSHYVGMSDDLDRRLNEHNNGHVHSTAGKRPWKRILSEEYPDRLSTRKREKYLKSASGRRFRKTLGLSDRE